MQRIAARVGNGPNSSIAIVTGVLPTPPRRRLSKTWVPLRTTSADAREVMTGVAVVTVVSDASPQPVWAAS